MDEVRGHGSGRRLQLFVIASTPTEDSGDSAHLYLHFRQPVSGAELRGAGCAASPPYDLRIRIDLARNERGEAVEVTQ
jgi:hypothetical protein